MNYFNPQNKIKPKRNQDYLKFIRNQKCIVSSRTGEGIEAHHVRRHYWGAGCSIKPHDYCTLPVHNEFHDPAIEKNFNVNTLIIKYMVKYISMKFSELTVIGALIDLIEGLRGK